MEEKRADRRVVKTRRAIRGAFLKLWAEKALDKITIKEIAETADVDRKTVYNYYESVGDILEELENELVENFEEKTKELDYGVEDPFDFFKALTEVLNENLDLYSQLMSSESNTGFMEKVFVFLREKMQESLLSSGIVPLEKAELASEFIAAGMSFSYRTWFQSNRSTPLSELSKAVGTLVMDGVNRYLLG